MSYHNEYDDQYLRILWRFWWRWDTVD